MSDDVSVRKDKSPIQIAIESRGNQLTPAQRLLTQVTPNFVERAIVGAATGAQPGTIQPRSGAQGIQRDLQSAGMALTGLPRDFLNAIGQTANYLGGQDPRQAANWGDYAFGAAPGRFTDTIGGSDSARANSAALRGSSQEARRQQAAAAAAGGGGGGGSAGPDFSAYRNALVGQADELNARIQAMYNQLAEQAGANVQRVQDIYGGAQAGVGDIYDSAAGNIQQAYSSAQQQGADQLARLGIEAAAPAVVDPMALSQAQAVSGLETGRAGGLSALGRYGATAQDFGSQMGQVAQQQSTEMNSAILAALQNRLNDSLLMEQQGRMSGGGGGGSAQDVLSAYQQAQLMAGAEGRGISAAQWEYEQKRRLDMDAANLALQISKAEGIPYTEALAQATGIVSGQPVAPAQPSGNWFTNLWK
jgi:hypothetical protein